MGSDSDSEGPTAASSVTSDGSKEVRTPPGPPCKTATVPKSLRGISGFLYAIGFMCGERITQCLSQLYYILEYNIETCTRYKLLPCYDPITTTGPDLRAAAANVEDESEQEDAGLWFSTCCH